MADEKISQLDAVTDVLDDDDYVLARAGASKRITGASLKADLGGSIPDPVTVPLHVQPADDTDAPLVLHGRGGADVFDVQANGDINNFGDGSTFWATFFGEFMNLVPNSDDFHGQAVLRILSPNGTDNDGVQVQNGAFAGAMQFQVGAEGFMKITLLGGRNLLIFNLPTADPNEAGAIWVDADNGNVLKLSATT